MPMNVLPLTASGYHGYVSKDPFEIREVTARILVMPTIIARKRQRKMKVFSVVYWSGASPRTGYSKSAHAAHGLGG